MGSPVPEPEFGSETTESSQGPQEPTFVTPENLNKEAAERDAERDEAAETAEPVVVTENDLATETSETAADPDLEYGSATQPE